jgi:glycosyltransferase involved in cell wall biosynthesis
MAVQQALGKQPSGLRSTPNAPKGDILSQMRKPRVALIGHLLGPQIYGAERSMLAMLAAIDRSKYDVSCVLPGSNGGGLRAAIRRITKRHLNDGYLRAIRRHTNEIHIIPYRGWSSARLEDSETVSHFMEYFSAHKIDLVHVNTITLLDPLIAARRKGIPSIVHARELIDQDEELARGFGMAPAEIVYRIRSAADFIICNSDATHRLFYKQDRSFRLYNPVDVNEFDLPNEVTPGRLKIGIISSNRLGKGVDHFFQLAFQAATLEPGLEFIVVGPRTDSIKQLARTVTRGVDGVNLRFAGYVDETVAAMRLLNVVVSLSTFAESFGRSIAEGMAARRPVIIYNRGAPPEYVRDGIDGFIVQPSDIAAALNYVELLRRDPARLVRMGEAARSRISGLFSPTAIASQLNDIYAHIFAMRRLQQH